MTFTGWGVPEKATDTSRLPKLWPFAHRVIGLTPEMARPCVDPATIRLPESRLSAASIRELGACVGVDHVAVDHGTRLLHCYGKSYRDLLRARLGQVERAPDAVVFPGTHAEVERLLAWAGAQGVRVIPFGGGTNIVGGVEASPTIAEPIVTVSLRRLNQMLALDEASGVATLGAGMLGPELEDALNRRGFTLGHFPDSFEFSTLGGWIATRSAGMQSDARGKIEDMVVGLTVATPSGTLVTRAVPRAAAGPDLKQLIVGSEGALGIITSATMRVARLRPREYRGFLFPTFEAGVGYARRIWELGLAPTTMRLSNAQETQFGMVLKPPSKGLSHLATRAAMAYLRRVRGYDLDQTCVMILGWELPADELARKRRAALRLLREFNGFDGGAGAGNAWYARKYDYPYLRDLVMGHGGMCDVTETAVLWKDVLPTYDRIHRGLREEVQAPDCAGYVGCHLSHMYAEGVCLYFTFGARQDERDPLGQYLRVKGRAMDLVLSSGAALSHHHSIGYEHLPWLGQHVGPLGLKAFRDLKRTFDPAGVCNPGRLVPEPDSLMTRRWPGRAAGTDSVPQP
ncbi:FAD-binding oxidoreductase [Opitutus sp. ER46]|uniref:FAD-binding oxidoreductase n=1 Tax=Opitutus sp. ER46 TaxID=2161864 RepID=UPI001304C52C|nr:FAD-binding oxidoreductase [Opitutus sp. ER46]